MRIHKEGYSTLLLSLGILITVNAILFFWFPSLKVAGMVFLVFSIIAILFFLWFFRVPQRNCLIDGNLIISPADGEIVAIEETMETEYYNQKRLQVSVFMSPLNVHANAYPISGSVRYYKYHPGKYLVAWHPKASTENESNTIVIENNDSISVMVRQIAGAVARRIVCYAGEGDIVNQGDELGFIKFGSRVDLFLPPGVKVKVKIGQHVTAKNSVIASFK